MIDEDGFSEFSILQVVFICYIGWLTVSGCGQRCGYIVELLVQSFVCTILLDSMKGHFSDHQFQLLSYAHIS